MPRTYGLTRTGNTLHTLTEDGEAMCSRSPRHHGGVRVICAVFLCAVATVSAMSRADTSAGGCVAEVRMYEDGSWSGERVTVDGALVASRWTPAELGWHPAWQGAACTISVTRSATQAATDNGR